MLLRRFYPGISVILHKQDCWLFLNAANVQAAAQDIPVRAVVFVTYLIHCLIDTTFLHFNFFWHCNVSLKFI